MKKVSTFPGADVSPKKKVSAKPQSSVPKMTEDQKEQVMELVEEKMSAFE